MVARICAACFSLSGFHQSIISSFENRICFNISFHCPSFLIFSCVAASLMFIARLCFSFFGLYVFVFHVCLNFFLVHAAFIPMHVLLVVFVFHTSLFLFFLWPLFSCVLFSIRRSFSLIFVSPFFHAVFILKHVFVFPCGVHSHLSFFFFMGHLFSCVLLFLVLFLMRPFCDSLV